MPVPKNQISTVAQAYDYAIGSANAAKQGVCPSQEGTYLQLAAQVTAGAFGTTTLNKASWTAALASADAMCINAPDYKKATTTAAMMTPGEAAAANGGISPPPVLKAGFPWWIVLLLGGGALVYYLATKKEGSSLSRGEHLVRKVKSKRKRRSARSRRKR